MPKGLTTPDHLFDRTWRPGHPFRPRISRARRWIMGIFLVLLSTIICGYWYITDSSRVRVEAEAYLSRLLGGHVRVGSATLSIFQGLKLDDVRLMTDRSNAPESLLFSAQSFMIQVDYKSLLTGRLEASRIVAVEPRVHLAEDADTGKRNYNRLLDNNSQSQMPSASTGANLVLPEIVLRNAQIQYTRFQHGQVIESCAIGIEGQLTPVPASKVYRFSLQSRSRATEIGPVITGEMVMGTGQINASLQNLPFDTDLKTMLPPQVRRWWEQHGLSGRVNIPVLNFMPPTSPDGRPGYKVEIELQGVTLVAHPEEWMGADEHRMLRHLRGAFDAMRMAGLNGRNFVDRVAELVEPAPISLRQVRGRFIFSDDETIQIEDLYGWLEEMPFRINGWIKGYTPDAEAKIRISSSDFQDIMIPAVPRYLNSLPPAVREIYDRFKPRGVCRFWVDLNRPVAGARPIVTGQIDIVDGNFTFERFPYPIRQATGRIILGQNLRTGEESLTLDHIRGRGLEGGPNANSFVEVNGVIGPFGPEAQVDITVKGEKITSEPAIMAAFPTLTRKALTMFDAPGKGEFPKFTGDFECKIIRLRGIEPRWIIETAIQLHDAAGSLVAFPYPMNGVRGNLKIMDDHIELTGITMNRGDASLKIDGRVSWPASNAPRDPTQGPSLKPNLKIVANNIPIDSDLLNALPPARSAWLRNVGAAGLIDIDGTIRPATNAGEDLDYDLRIALQDGTLWPVDGMFAVSGVHGNLRLTNQRITLNDIKGKRGDADLAARGEIAWPKETPKVTLQAQATNLAMEPTLYRILPASARAAWDQVRPEGTVDVALLYSGEVLDANASNASAAGYEVTITPRKLSANPLAVPYQLEQVTGSVTILPERVVLKDLAARHGDARVRLSGSGATGDKQSWNFVLSGEGVPVDDDLKRAVPKSVAEVMQSVQLAGKVNFDFSKLHVSFPPGTGMGSGTRPGLDVSPAIDFVVRLGTDSAAMDVGVPLSDVKGALTMAGSSRSGKLSTLTGKMDVESLTLAGRTVTRFGADIIKEADRDQMMIRNMQAQIAKGSMAGKVDFLFSDHSPSKYMVELAVRNADVKELAGETEAEIQGLLSASLSLEGIADQPNSRRGRGDVIVNGERLYRIPLVLGLLQITNLALPVNRPFNEGSARYSIDSNRVTFETIELRSPQMLMQGNGYLDFNTRQVRMKFFADSTAWPKLPVIAEILQGAKNELLQIQVRGTLQEPKVSARSMNTLSTTVDEILGADGRPATQANGR